MRSFYSTPQINLLQRRPFLETLPADEPVVGYATNQQGLEPGLWHPFDRRVDRVLPDDSRADLQQRKIRFVAVDEHFLLHARCTIEELMQRYDARLVERLTVPHGWRQNPSYIYLIELN